MKKIALFLTLIMLVSCSELGGSENPVTAHVIERDIVYDSSDSAALAYLTEEEKAGYETLKQAAVAMNNYVVFDTPFTKEQIIKIFNLVYTEENGIFWLDSIALPRADENAVNISFRYSKEDVKYMQGVLNQKLNDIIANIPGDADDYDKIRFIHDYIVLNTSFTENGENVSSAYGVLIDGEGQCEGYAFAFGLLASKTGLECITITGTDKNGNSHAWNKVKSNGEWYNVDCTWDDPVINYENPGYLRHNYMLVPDKDIMGITHFENISYFVSPGASAFTDNYYYCENLIFDKADNGIKILKEQIDTAALTKSTECEIRFSVKSAYDEALRKLYDEEDLRRIIDTVNASKSSPIKNVYTAKDDTLFIIHLSLVY